MITVETHLTNCDQSGGTLGKYDHSEDTLDKLWSQWRHIGTLTGEIFESAIDPGSTLTKGTQGMTVGHSRAYI